MDVPSKLFKYRAFDKCHDAIALEQSYLWASPYCDLNDPMEALLNFNFAKDKLSLPHDVDLKKFVGNQTQVIENAATVCFSASHKLLNMWGYYANSFKGVCLEYDREELLTVGQLAKQTFKEVEYSEEPPEDFAFSNFENIAAKNQNITRRLFKKHTAWSGEQEWRVVCGQSGKFSVSESALTSVYLGPRITESNKQQLLSILELRATSVFQLSIEKYDLKSTLLQQGRPPNEVEKLAGPIAWSLASFGTEEEVKNFFGSNFDQFLRLITDLSKHPNFQSISNIQVSETVPETVVCCFTYVFRENDYKQHARKYFNSNLEVVKSD